MTGLLRKLLRFGMRRILLRVPSRKPEWLQQLHSRHSLGQRPGSQALDLGCGGQPRNPFGCAACNGIDLMAGPDIVVCDLSDGRLPVAFDSVQVVTAIDLLEHIPRTLPRREPGATSVRFPLIELMDEIHRVLAPGGLFHSATPCYPWPAAFQDPTHVNIMTEETLKSYFCGAQPWAATYGFRGRFELLAEAWIDSHYHALLRKPMSSH